MSVPESIREAIKQRLWSEADRLTWPRLSGSVKSTYYDSWARDPEIGDVLSRFMTRSQVRVYIKDSIMKDYLQERLSDPVRPLRILGLNPQGIQKEFQKPHGVLTRDGRLVVWGRAEQWKLLLMTLHERAYQMKHQPHAVVLMDALGRFKQDLTREVVESAAERLGIAQVVWLDM